MAVTVACVLRSGGEYQPWHVDRLRQQVGQYLPDARFLCLSDVDVSVFRKPLKYAWPGWWSKMELFRPDIRGDLLYFDLDTTIFGPLDDIASVRRLTLLRDFYKDGTQKPERIQSGMMFLPETDRAAIWSHWIADPSRHMREHRGDGEYLHSLLFERAARWQDMVPGQVVSYKVHVRGRGVPAGARVICFHGQPRPWVITDAWARAA